MQLVVPIEDTSSGNSSSSSNHCIDKQNRCDHETESRSASDSLERNPINVGPVLSDDLRDQFEAMKSVWRQARRGSGDFDTSLSTGSNVARERQENLREELKRKERETAIETAIMMERELSLWQEGIADLEALLADEDEQESNEETLAEADEHSEVEDDIPLGIREVVFAREMHEQAPAEIQFPFLSISVEKNSNDAGNRCS